MMKNLDAGYNWDEIFFINHRSAEKRKDEAYFV
jgi:hypothetical protein